MIFKGFGIQKQDPNVTQNRQKYVGGSDVATILGINQYKTAFELAREKIGLDDKPFISNAYTDFGNRLEPQIREYINTVNDVNFVVKTYVDEDNGIRSNVDGIDEVHDLLLEIKTHGSSPKKAAYRAQMQLYMYQSGANHGWLALYERPSDFDLEFDSDRLVIEEIERDDDEIDRILEAIETFWIRCEFLKDSPDMTEHEFMVVGTDMDKTVAKLNAIAPRIINMKEQLKQAEKQEKTLKEELYNKMTENDIKKIETPLLTVTRILPGKIKRFDTKTFKSDYPDLYNDYQNEIERSGYVRLTATKKE